MSAHLIAIVNQATYAMLTSIFHLEMSTSAQSQISSKVVISAHQFASKSFQRQWEQYGLILFVKWKGGDGIVMLWNWAIVP